MRLEATSLLCITLMWAAMCVLTNATDFSALPAARDLSTVSPEHDNTSQPTTSSPNSTQQPSSMSPSPSPSPATTASSTFEPNVTRLDQTHAPNVTGNVTNNTNIPTAPVNATAAPANATTAPVNATTAPANATTAPTNATTKPTTNSSSNSIIHWPTRIRLYGIDYNPRIAGPSAPQAQQCKSRQQIQQDMQILRKVADRVRIHSLLDCAQAKEVLPAAKQAGLQVHLGMSTSSHHEQIEAEMQELEKLLASGLIDPNVIGLNVGSEAIYRNTLKADQAIVQLKEVQSVLRNKSVSLPVTIAEPGAIYGAQTQLIEAVDYVMYNDFPFWAQKSIDNAASSMINTFNKASSIIKSQFPGKPVVIGETGWSSQGNSEASERDQVQYFKDLYELASQSHGELPYYWFTAFDSTWHTESAVQDHFGLFDADGQLKRAFRDVVLLQ